ncbi:MAG: hypothetical protein LRY54_00195 [Alphaproteobacteria bacterium]|nr:hypothetical protein [Alphaproteobacteria bacterium]
MEYKHLKVLASTAFAAAICVGFYTQNQRLSDLEKTNGQQAESIRRICNTISTIPSLQEAMMNSGFGGVGRMFARVALNEAKMREDTVLAENIIQSACQTPTLVR